MLALTIWLWATGGSAVVLLLLMGLQRLLVGPASAPGHPQVELPRQVRTVPSSTTRVADHTTAGRTA